MARRKQNPIKDIGNQVGSWLGGAARVYADITDRSRDDQPGRLPQVQAALNATRAIGKVVDTATGGFGGAVVSDAQRMAKTGSSTPSALYKTAAANLAAGAAGVGAAKVAGKVADNILGTQYQFHGSKVKNLKQLRPTPARGTNLPDRLFTTSNPRAAEDYVILRNPVEDRGSVYVVKGGSKSFKPTSESVYSPYALSQKDSFVTTKPKRVIGEITTPLLRRGERYIQPMPDLESRIANIIAADKKKSKLLSDAAKGAAGVAAGAAALSPKKKSRGGGKNKK